MLLFFFYFLYTYYIEVLVIKKNAHRIHVLITDKHKVYTCYNSPIDILYVFSKCKIFFNPTSIVLPLIQCLVVRAHHTVCTVMVSPSAHFKYKSLFNFHSFCLVQSTFSTTVHILQLTLDLIPHLPGMSLFLPLESRHTPCCLLFCSNNSSGSWE